MIAAIPAAAGDAMSVPQFLFILICILVGAKLFGELAERVGQPAVLGELLAGVVLGSSVLGIVDPGVEVVHLLAEVGVILLLFQIGLETDLGRLLQVGTAAAVVALVGVFLPFAGGYIVASMLGLATLPAVVCGAALTATSVGITARVLSDLGRLQEPESQIVLGAAVLDDVIGLVILAVVAQVMAGAELTAFSIARTTGVAFGFLIAVLALGKLIVPPLFDVISRVGREETLGTMAVALAFLVAWLADAVGSALIIGAFAAGLVLAPTRHAHVIEHGVLRLSMLFVPIFFVAVGAAVDVRSFADPAVLTVGGALIAVAIIGKFAAGYAPFWFRGKKAIIGAGMIPRGEVGLIFAQMGLTSGVLSAGIFSALTMMVMVTTFVAPPLLRQLFPPIDGGSPLDGEGRGAMGGVSRVTTEA
ncbi:MAG TPA: cation:proton antiporter [Longimicrobiales bacterium]|nr:cation:proton antiporter [Longimicrobiales bacterium]